MNTLVIDKTTREINVNPYLLNFDNGLYNLQTDDLNPHAPHILSTIRLCGSCNPEVKFPTFLWYLGDVLPATEIPLIQEILGYFLAPINKAQKSFLMVGKSDSGKSTLLYVVQDLLLRQENVSNLTWQELDEKFATVQLFGKLANIFAWTKIARHCGWIFIALIWSIAQPLATNLYPRNGSTSSPRECPASPEPATRRMCWRSICVQ
ncbi:MAG: hypothetical protein LBU32_13980 [Clostridiales bacterium]|nr:hypothetical protein [Clostridiales bacterium]